jgi:hypothetical protein
MRKRQVEKKQRKVKFVSYIMGSLAFTADDNVRDNSFIPAFTRNVLIPFFRARKLRLIHVTYMDLILSP